MGRSLEHYPGYLSEVLMPWTVAGIRPGGGGLRGGEDHPPVSRKRLPPLIAPTPPALSALLPRPGGGGSAWRYPMESRAPIACKREHPGGISDDQFFVGHYQERGLNTGGADRPVVARYRAGAKKRMKRLSDRVNTYTSAPSRRTHPAAPAEQLLHGS